jgi:hypothetical protein
MSRKMSSYTADRRTFLKKLAAAGGATAAVAMSGQAAVASPEQGKASAPAKQRGYHETPHIHSYYRSARL